MAIRSKLSLVVPPSSLELSEEQAAIIKIESTTLQILKSLIIPIFLGAANLVKSDRLKW